MAAAIRYRLQDVADLAWIPVDAILKSRLLSNLVVLVPTAATALVLLHHDGTYGALASAESISAIGAAHYTLIRVGRWWRGIKPLEPKARRQADARKLTGIRAGSRCSQCGSTTALLEYDHIVPLAMGGTSSAENLPIVCAQCNERMGG